MRRKIYFNAAIIFTIILLINHSQNLFAEQLDQQEISYKEQHDSYTKEISSLESLISTYSNCVEQIESFNAQITALKDQRIQTGEKKHATLNDRLVLIEKRREIQDLALKTYNEAKSEQKKDITLKEIKEELSYCQERLKEITEKKQELKNKVLENNGVLPSWWIN